MTREFKDTSQFCFPDLDTICLERAELSESEHFISTLTDGEGRRIFAICMRCLAAGEGQRYDVKRRPRNCLCIISKHPYFSMFRSILMQIQGLMLIENATASAIGFLNSVYNITSHYPGQFLSIRPTKSCHMLSDFHLFIPRHGELAHKEIPIRPLLESVGVERFLLILRYMLTS